MCVYVCLGEVVRSRGGERKRRETVSSPEEWLPALRSFSHFNHSILKGRTIPKISLYLFLASIYCGSVLPSNSIDFLHFQRVQEGELHLADSLSPDSELETVKKSYWPKSC